MLLDRLFCRKEGQVMSRYIDADALTKEIKQDIADNGLTERYVFYRINDAPSIDIVRCQDCKYWVYNFNGCSRNPCTEPWYATDFCNYGERNNG